MDQHGYETSVVEYPIHATIGLCYMLYLVVLRPHNSHIHDYLEP